MNNDKRIRTLILGYDGNKSHGILGFLCNYVDVLNQIENFYGVGNGNLICFLLSLNLSPAIINMELFITDILASRSLRDKSLINYLRDLLVNTTFDVLGIIPTFQEHYELTGKYLAFQVYNLTAKSVEVLDYKTVPHLSVIDACISSMSEPSTGQVLNYCGNVYQNCFFCAPIPILDENLDKYTMVITSNMSEMDIENLARKSSRDYSEYYLSKSLEFLKDITLKRYEGLNCKVYRINVMDGVEKTPIERRYLMSISGFSNKLRK